MIVLVGSFSTLREVEPPGPLALDIPGIEE
jgi:hypothetical protein